MKSGPVVFPWNHLLALAACAVMAAGATPLRERLDLANIVMLFLLVVLLVARYLGREPAITAAFASVALFDFFFVPPRLSFAVNDGQYLVTFAVMLATALVTGALTSGLRREAREAAEREQRMAALHEMARELAGAMSVEQVEESIGGFLRQALGADSALLLPDPGEQLRRLSDDGPRVEIHLALMALKNGQTVEWDPLAAQGYAVAYFALNAPTRPRGVLAVAPANGDGHFIQAQRPLIEAAASLVAIALERLHYVEAAQTAEIGAAADRLRASLLSALSHDLRGPLTALRGTAETLAMTGCDPRELSLMVRDQAVRLSRMVENLLDMARLQAGKVVLRKEWQPIEEVIGSSLKLMDAVLAGRPVVIRLPSDLPLLHFDGVLIERVLCNLLENAVKYSPPGSPIDIAAEAAGNVVRISVADQGQGFPPGREEAVFGLFERGAPESPQAGVGLGLAICRAIVEAHGGRIEASNRAAKGAVVTFGLPAGAPPGMVDEEQSALPAATGGEAP
ncbi:MAG: DUF4118 domain-containing protein [Betaproteobacteria bacterium]